MAIVSEKFETITATAKRLFAERDYEGITTLEISKGAKVTEPLIYYHFSGKPDLYAHIVRTTHDLYQDMLRKIPKSGKPKYRLNALVGAHCQFLKDYPHEAALVFRPVPHRLESGRADLEKLVAGAREDLKNLLVTYLQGGIAEGTFADVNVPLTADLLALMLFRLFESALDKSVKINGSALKAFFRRGLEGCAD